MKPSTLIAVILALLACRLAPAQVPIGFGVNTHRTNALDIKRIAAAGFTYIRTDLFWEYTETERGVYDFHEYDTLMAELSEQGLKAMFILDFNNPLYQPGSDKQGPSSATVFTAYANWAAAAVSHFAGRGVVWEIWNEPNNAPFWGPAPNVHHYMALAKAASQAIKGAHPNEILIGPSSTFSDRNTVSSRDPNNGLSFLNACFGLGLLNVVDGVSEHSYRPRAANPETVLDFYAAVQDLMRKYRQTLPIVSSEWGYSRTEVDEATQAKYVVRSFLCNAIAGVPLSIWYDWSDDGTDPRSREDNFGLVSGNAERTAHEGYAAATVFNAVAKHGTFQGRVPGTLPDDYVVKYRTPTGLVFIAWTTGRAHPANLSIGGGAFQVTDYLGQPQPNAKAERMPLDDGPRYLRPLPAIPPKPTSK